MGLGKLPCSLMNCTYLAVWNSEYFLAQCPRSRLRYKEEHKPWSALPLIISCKGPIRMSLTKHSECAPTQCWPSLNSSTVHDQCSSQIAAFFSLFVVVISTATFVLGTLEEFQGRKDQRADSKFCIAPKFQVRTHNSASLRIDLSIPFSNSERGWSNIQLIQGVNCEGSHTPTGSELIMKGALAKKEVHLKERTLQLYEFVCSV